MENEWKEKNVHFPARPHAIVDIDTYEPTYRSFTYLYAEKQLIMIFGKTCLDKFSSPKKGIPNSPWKGEATQERMCFADKVKAWEV